MHIRPETAADIPAIYALTKAAFAPMAFSDGTEADCLNQLRDDGDLTLSFVATEGDTIIGHVAFSPVFIDDHADGWYGLGPVAVDVARQKQGIGSQLVAAGHAALRDLGAKGVVLIGKPEVYGPMGYVSDGKLSYRDLPSPIIQHHAFTDEAPTGQITFSPGLEA